MTSGEAWLIAIIGGALSVLLATGISAIFSARVRNRFWKPIARTLRWPFTIRLTTRARQAEIERDATQLRERATVSDLRFQEVCDVLDVRPVLADSTLVPERIRRLQKASAEAWAHAKAEVATAQAFASSQVKATESLTQSQMAAALRINQAQINLARETSFDEGRAAGVTEARAEVETLRAVPLLRPAWRIDELGAADAFVLRNTQHDVVIRDVSVNAPTGDFRFAGATQMRGGIDRHFEFYGAKTETGRRLGVDFVVKWQDIKDDWWSQCVRIDREPRRAVVL